MMRKAAQQARDFADHPPVQVSFVPVPYKLIEESRRKGDGYHYTLDGVPFDPMEIGDLVVLVHSTKSYYQGGKPPTVSESWYPAVCVSAAENRVFQLRDGVRWKEGKVSFKIYRVPYQWRAQLYKFLGQEFSSRTELEAVL